jgi:hypothetical protein
MTDRSVIKYAVIVACGLVSVKAHASPETWAEREMAWAGAKIAEN